MQVLCDQIRQHPYPRDLDHIAQEFGPQLDEVSCGAAAVHHGLLLGGLTIPKAALQAIFRTYPNPGPDAYDYIDEERLKAGLEDSGFEPEWVELKSRKFTPEFLERSTPQFLERLAQEMEGGAFVIACIYLWEGADGQGSHWITVGRWKHGRIRVVDSYWDPLMYSLWSPAFDACAWGNTEVGYSVLLVRPGIWQKNYEEWLPGRDRLLRLEGHHPEPSATLAHRLHAAATVLNDDRYGYEQLEFCVSEKSSMAVKVRDPRKQAIAVSTPTADEKEGQVVVVRRLAQPSPPEVILRISLARGN